MRVNVTVINKDGVSMYFSQEMIESFDITDNIGLILPSATVSLQIRFSADIEFFKELNLKVKFDFGFIDKTNTYFFRAVEQKILFQPNTATVTLFCLPTFRSGYLLSQIKSYKDKKTEELIPTIAKDIGIEPPKIFCDIKTDDEQTWIQYNNPSFDFLREVVLHSKLANPEDTSLVAFTMNDEFWCVSYKDLMAKGPILTIKDYNFNGTEINIGDAEKDLIYKAGAKICEFKLKDEKRVPQSIFDFLTDSTVDNTPITNDNYVDYKVNFGNTYGEYNFAPLLNKQRWYELENNTLKIKFENLDGSLKMFDIVEVKLSTSYTGGITPIIDGKYFISGVNYSLRNGKFSTTFKISRKE